MTAHPLPGTDRVFGELGRIVLGEESLEQILQRLVQIAKQVMPITGEVSITVVIGDHPTTAAFTGDLAAALDERQYEADTGPCLNAAVSATRLLVTDTATDARWPRFTAAAVRAGIRSSLSIPLPVQRQLTGALNFYARDTNAFDERAIDLAETFAAHAAVAVANAQLFEATAQLAEQMQEAMATRAVIEQAKGIIMRDRSCSADEAFEELVRLSQSSHLKLRELAVRLVSEVTGSA